MRGRLPFLAAIAGLVGLGVTAAPQAQDQSVPIPREYVKAENVRLRRRGKKKKVPQLPLADGEKYIGPPIVPGKVNLWGLPALTTERLSMVAEGRRERIRHTYGRAHAFLRSSKGSQQVHRERRVAMGYVPEMRRAA